ncbi:hypothetical protein ANCCAN_23453, partial [Ancylostoma caninum]
FFFPHYIFQENILNNNYFLKRVDADDGSIFSEDLQDLLPQNLQQMQATTSVSMEEPLPVYLIILLIVVGILVRGGDIHATAELREAVCGPEAEGQAGEATKANKRCVENSSAGTRTGVSRQSRERTPEILARSHRKSSSGTQKLVLIRTH